jgi:bifunctional non-homologous end joining protein LigD
MNSLHPLPMLATLGPPPKRLSDYAVEAKYDGQRGMAVVSGGTVNLFSRNGADITRTFPEVTSALTQKARGYFWMGRSSR